MISVNCTLITFENIRVPMLFEREHRGRRLLWSSICQALIEFSYKYGELKASLSKVKFLLPDSTTASRRIRNLANEYRLILIETLKDDLSQVKRIGISAGYSKNTYTSDNYSTINLHYTKDKKTNCIDVKYINIYWLKSRSKYN